MQAATIGNREILAQRLAAQALMAKAFQSVFGLEPSAEQLNALSKTAFGESMCLMGFADEASESDADAFRTFVNDRSSESIERLRSEYTRLFIGPSKLPAPPWESAYRGEDRLLLQSSTLEVRALYRSQGVLPAQYPKVSDDHISLELSFLHLVTNRARELIEAGEGTAASSLSVAVDDIVNRHLLRWVPRFSQDLNSYDAQGYYAVSARLLVRFVQACSRLTQTV